METKPYQISDAIRKRLREPFPQEAYQEHSQKSFLTVLKAMYVIERLNDVFGLGRWNLEHEIINSEDGYILMKGQLKLLDYPDIIVPAQYGGHKTSGTGTEMADGYKSAITDCITKSASYLEIGIDVFKGLVKPPKSIKKEPIKSDKKTDEKPWLNQKTKEWDSAVKELNEGIMTINKLKTKYKFSANNEKELLKQADFGIDERKIELLPSLDENSKWQQAVKFLKDGGKIFDIKKKYDISEDNSKELVFQSIQP